MRPAHAPLPMLYSAPSRRAEPLRRSVFKLAAVIPASKSAIAATAPSHAFSGALESVELGVESTQTPSKARKSGKQLLRQAGMSVIVLNVLARAARAGPNLGIGSATADADVEATIHLKLVVVPTLRPARGGR